MPVSHPYELSDVAGQFVGPGSLRAGANAHFGERWPTQEECRGIATHLELTRA